MTRTHRRKLKNIIATTIAYTLSILILIIALLISLKIISLLATIITYQEVRQAMIFERFNSNSSDVI